MINCWCVMFENYLKAYCLFVDVASQLYCCELCLVMKMVISPLFVWICHSYYYDTWLWQMLCALKKNKKLNRMYYLKRHIMHCDGYYISWDVSHAAMVTIIEDRIARRDGCMDKFVPHVSKTERQRVCIIGQTFIIILDIKLHRIAHFYHWWTWSCVVDIVSAFLWKLWLMNKKLVVEDM